jgi:hypothetical protein
MARGKKYPPAIDAPLCARVAYEQLCIGTSPVFLLGYSDPLCEADKGLLRFLAARDGRQKKGRKGARLDYWADEKSANEVATHVATSPKFLRNTCRRVRLQPPATQVTEFEIRKRRTGITPG